MEYKYAYKENIEIEDSYVYSRMGMALLSAQRVEYITTQLLALLVEFDSTVYKITTPEFLANSTKAKKARKMLGQVFALLKLNPKLVIEDELNEYLKARNLLVHNFWRTYLASKSNEQKRIAIEFCDNFGRFSNRLESFFKGFLYAISLRHVKDRTFVSPELKILEPDFEFFLTALSEKHELVQSDK